MLFAFPSAWGSENKEQMVHIVLVDEFETIALRRITDVTAQSAAEHKNKAAFEVCGYIQHVLGKEIEDELEVSAASLVAFVNEIPQSVMERDTIPIQRMLGQLTIAEELLSGHIDSFNEVPTEWIKYLR